MVSIKPLLQFFVLLVVLSGILLFPWPQVERTHAAFFRMAGQTAFHSRFWFWSEGYVRFVDLHADDVREQIDRATTVSLPANMRVPRPDRMKDVLMICMNKSYRASFGMIRISSRIVGYWPLAFLTALVLAKPFATWRRKWIAWVLGLILTELFVLFRLSLHIMDACFAADKSYAIFDWGDTAKGILSATKAIMVDNPTFSFIVPLVIWILVAVTREDWNRLFNLLGALLGSQEDETGDPVEEPREHQESAAQ